MNPSLSPVINTSHTRVHPEEVTSGRRPGSVTWLFGRLYTSKSQVHFLVVIFVSGAEARPSLPDTPRRNDRFPDANQLWNNSFHFSHNEGFIRLSPVGIRPILYPAGVIYMYHIFLFQSPLDSCRETRQAKNHIIKRRTAQHFP